MKSIEFGDCRETMRRWAAQGVKAQMCVTSPPYFGLRSYGHEGQIGLEETPDQYIAEMREVFRCVWDVLADDGTLWLNLGDSYGAGKQLLGIPWRVAFALQSDGWILRQDIVWYKSNSMPESVRDRCTKAHEYIFLLSKRERYFIDSDGLKEPASKGAAGSNFHTGKTGEHQVGRASTKPRSKRDSFKRDDSKRGEPIVGQCYGTHRADREESEWDVETRNRRSVWTIATTPYKGAHFATFPTDLAERCILPGSRPGDVVLDPFMGSGTTAAVAIAHGRQYLGCELNPAYGDLQRERIDYATALRASGAQVLKPASERDAHTVDLFWEAA